MPVLRQGHQVLSGGNACEHVRALWIIMPSSRVLRHHLYVAGAKCSGGQPAGIVSRRATYQSGIVPVGEVCDWFTIKRDPRDVVVR